MAMERWRPMGTLMERDPFRDIQGEVNRVFDSFFGSPTSASSRMDRMWKPVVDLYETQDDVVVELELPGVREKDIALSITGDVLTVKGERQFDEQRNSGNSLYIERAWGKFERSIRLPMPVDAGRVKATYRDGVLEVRLPKAEEVRSREIQIQAA